VPYDRTLRGPVTLRIGAEPDTETSVDELAIYSRTLTEPQAAFLAASFEPPGARFDAIAQRLAEDDRILEERRALVGRLSGKTGRLIIHRGRPQRVYDFPEDIKAEGIRPEDISRTNLARFDVIYFPEGPHYEVQPEQYTNILQFVAEGGGYVGSCQGSFFAEKIGLLDIECYACNIWGLFAVTLKPHVITDGRDDVIHMHFGNGPIMVPGTNCTVAATYVASLPDRPTPAAIVAGRYGKGRVVLFGPHPLGGQVSRKGIKAFFSGKDLETERLLVNAMLYAAGLLGAGGEVNVPYPAGNVQRPSSEEG